MAMFNIETRIPRSTNVEYTMYTRIKRAALCGIFPCVAAGREMLKYVSGNPEIIVMINYNPQGCEH